MARNNTELRLLKVPLESDYKHTLYFDKELSQSSTMIGFTYKSKIYHDFSFQRKDHFIRIPDHYDNIVGANYVMYKNADTGDKWYYAFITDIQYRSTDKTDVYIKTDVMQTWMFDIEIKESFIEREHVSDDTIGNHTIPEGLEMGDYIINGVTKDPNLEIDGRVVFGSTCDPSEGEEIVGGSYNGIYSGVRYYAYQKGADVTHALQYLTDKGKGDGVSSLFLVPKFLLKLKNSDGTETDIVSAGAVGQTPTYQSYNFEVPKTYGFEGYTPKNNKLKTFPYTYLLASNGNGGTAQYKYEFFEPNLQCDFMVFGALTPGCSIRMIPAIYKGVQLPESEGLNLGKFPQCNWATDQYVNWLTQNAVNIATQSISGGFSIGVGIVTMNPLAIANGVQQVAQTMQQTYNADREPPQVKGNINCGDVVTSMGNNTFTYYNMSIRKEYAQIIDRYFDMFGYKVNAVKVPNKNHRSNWWFIKTIDVNITGGIPTEDMQKIKECYNNGITFWKDRSTMRDYSKTNRIV